jgi:hypothetical protein
MAAMKSLRAIGGCLPLALTGHGGAAAQQTGSSPTQRQL